MASKRRSLHSLHSVKLINACETVNLLESALFKKPFIVLVQFSNSFLVLSVFILAG